MLSICCYLTTVLLKYEKVKCPPRIIITGKKKNSKEGSNLFPCIFNSFYEIKTSYSLSINGPLRTALTHIL